MSTSTAGKSSSRAGFSLIELVVVLIVVGVSLGLVLPQVGGFLYRDDMKACVRKLAKTIGHARGRAITTGTIWAVIFDFTTQECWAAPVQYERTSEDAAPVLKYGTPEEKNALSGEVRFTQVQVWDKEPVDHDQAVVRILPRGLTEPALVTMEDKTQERTLSLRLKPFGGRLSLAEDEDSGS
jgi:prepilin-type N-terminal cleavage/methylation domain-containing protein